MAELKAIDTLFPLLLKEWKDSWVDATNSPGELKCSVEAAWGEGYTNADEIIKTRITVIGRRTQQAGRRNRDANDLFTGPSLA